MRQITTKHDIHRLGTCLKTPGGAAAKDIGRGPGVAGLGLPVLLCALCALLRLISVFILVHPWLMNFACLLLIPLWASYQFYQLFSAFVTLLFNFRVWPSARPENDRKTTGFTKPLKPEFNFG
jgi:hypothetical protein